MVKGLWARWRAMRPARRAAVALGALLCAGVAAMAVAYSLTRMAPGWWTDAQTGDALLAQEFENAVLTQLSTVRPPDGSGEYRSARWKVALGEADINAWLTHRLPGWLSNRDESFRWPHELSAIRTAWREGSILIGVEFTENGRTRVISMEVSPRLDERGALWLAVDSVRVGRLTLPASWVLEDGMFAADALGHQDVRRAVEIATGRRPLMTDALLPVDASRGVRLLELSPRTRRLDVTARTELIPR